MKIYIEDDDGNRTELTEITDIDDKSDVLVFKMNCMLTQQHIHDFSDMLSKVFGKPCVIFGPELDKIYGLKK